MENITITIYKALDDTGYLFDIYECEPSQIDDDDSSKYLLDGGHCTSEDIKDAFEMATEQTKDILKDKTIYIYDNFIL